MKLRSIRSSLIHWNSAGNFIRQRRVRYNLGSVNWGTSGMKFSSERVVITVLEMVGFGVRVRCGAHVLKTGFCKRRLVLWQCSLRGAAGTEEHKGDERRENG